ncbi:MAG: hypothetical protein ABIO70_24750 [Pseudomonadota bacterium]
MPNPAIPREDVHRLAEACSDDPKAFEPSALRLSKAQRRIGRFIEANAPILGAQSAQVAIYMSAVCLRIFEQVGGRMQKVSGTDLGAAATRIGEVAAELYPADAGFAERAKAVAWRAQPHLLDEVIWALFEKEEREEGEAEMDTEAGALVYLSMWAVVEAMDARWTPPAGYGG